MKPGTSGAISLEGTAAGLIAALALSTLALQLGLIGPRFVWSFDGGATVGAFVESALGATLEGPRNSQQRPVEFPEHGSGGGRRGGTGRVVFVVSDPASRARGNRVALYLEFARPFTLDRAGARVPVRRGRQPSARRLAEPWSLGLFGPPLIGSLMAAVLNAGNNALNQIYDLEIDRINKPKRPLPTAG